MLRFIERNLAIHFAMTLKGFIIRLLGVALTCIAVSACTGSGGERSEVSDGEHPLDARYAFGEIEVEGDSLEKLLAELIAEFSAGEVAYSDCLKAYGFDYKPRLITYDLKLAGDRLLTREEYAGSFGYGIGFADTDHGVSVEIRGGGIPPSQIDGLNEFTGSRIDDCTPLLPTQDIQEAIYLASNADIDSDERDRIVADQRFVDAQNAWSICMKKSGYDYATSSAAFDDLNTKYESSPQFDGWTHLAVTRPRSSSASRSPSQVPTSAATSKKSIRSYG